MSVKSSIAVSCVLAAAASYAAAPKVERFLFDQSKLSHEVTVSFDLAAESVLTMDVLTNGVSIGWRNFRSAVKGAALNAVNPAGSYVLKWKPSTTWTPPEDKIPAGGIEIEIKAWSTGNTPDYMVVDLTSSSNVCYYVDEADLPLPVTNTLYKTDAMVFKRMHGACKTWRMGSPTDEAGRPNNVAGRMNRERPHLVTFSADWYMAVFETTQRQWKRIQGTAGTNAEADDAFPAVNMTYKEIRGQTSANYWPAHGHAVTSDSAAAKFAALTGIKVDLPTEAQWEYACRGGTTTAYNIGETNGAISKDDLSRIARWVGNSTNETGSVTNCTAVGSYEPNGYGLYDMVGNVSEFCVDNPAYDYSAELQIDPVGEPELQDSSYGVTVRGSRYTQAISAWYDPYNSNAQPHRSAYRGYYYAKASSSFAWAGFRFASPVGDWAPMSFASSGAAQDAGTRTVNIVYDLSEDAIVTLSATTNGVALPDAALRSAAGDVNRLVTAGTGKRICWNPDESWPGQIVDSGVEFKIQKWPLSDPPPYMALDLTHSCMTNIFWYSSADAMPEPITNDIWKTDFMVMRRVPAKDVVWMMGVATNSAGASVEGLGYDIARSPRHRVKLSQDYYIGVFEVTRRQARLAWSAAAAAGDTEDLYTLPLTNSYTSIRPRKASVWPQNGHVVGSNSALDKMRQRFDLQFDLPTEAQWEYACRACTGSAFCGFIPESASNGNTPENLTEYGWFKNNASSVLQPVGTRKPNAFGIYDMHGNAHEYCLDACPSGDVANNYGLSPEALASDEPTVDPYGPSGSVVSDSNRIMRGGSCGSEYYGCRSGDRSQKNHPDSAWTTTGCRFVCPLPGATFPDPVIPQAGE